MTTTTDAAAAAAPGINNNSNAVGAGGPVSASDKNTSGVAAVNGATTTTTTTAMTTTTTTNAPPAESAPAADAESVAAASETSSVFVEGKLVMALYYPPPNGSADGNNNNNNNAPTPVQPIWWPAKTYSSVNTFCEIHQEEMDRQLTESVQAGRISKKQKSKMQHKLMANAVWETSKQNKVHTLYYLSRPLCEYQMAGPRGGNSGNTNNNPVEVDDVLKVIAKAGQKYMYQPQYFSSQEIYIDFHKAYQQAMTEMYQDDSDSEEESNQDRKADENQDHVLTNAQKAWNDYQNLQEEQAIIPAAAAAAAPVHHQHHEQQRQEPVHHHRHEDHHEQQHQHLGSPMGHSVAAVSCTEDSLVSYNTRDTHTPARSSRKSDHEERASTVTKQSHAQPELPEKLSSPIMPKASFDALWHKFELEGWEMYQNADGVLVFAAPNGYTFKSQQAFYQYLQDEYEWQAPPPPGKTRRQLDLEQREKQEADYKRRSLLWNYCSKALGWNYDFKSKRETLGMEGEYLYFRPGFGIKNRGVRGQDHFLSLEELEKYCRLHDIQPPPTPPRGDDSGSSSEEDDRQRRNRRKTGKRSGEDEEEDVDAMDTAEEEEEEEEEIPASPDADDDGYETPTDQAPTPQDPGKPLERDDSDNDAVESGDDDEARYQFSRLWKKLKQAGWYWKRGPSELDDWWYYKPVQSRSFDEDSGPKKMQEGLDYFTSPDAVIAYIKARDAKLDGKSKKKAKKSHKSERPTKKSKSDKHADAQQTKRNVAEKPADPALDHTSKGKKRGRDAKGAMAEATAKKLRCERLKPKSETCTDSGLTVESTHKHSPWAKRPPLFEHKVVTDLSTGISYNSPYYYLPGESPGDYTQRFENITELVQFCAQSDKFDVAADGASPSKDSHKQEFERYLRYAFVPGKPSEWAVIRMITQSEASHLLAKAQYRKMAGEDKTENWYPPGALVAADKLESKYTSLESLCVDLRRLEDVERVEGSSRRRKQGNLSQIQVMALRLAIADGFGEEEVTSQEEEDTDPESSTESEPMEIAPPKKSAPASKMDKNAPVAKNTKDKKRELSAEEDRSMLSPDKIKVRYDGNENTAPWATPLLPDKWKWHNLFTKMGCTYKGGTYYMPGKNYKNTSDDFTRISQLQRCICEEGDYNKYLDKLDDEEEKSVARRYFNYANVPGTEHDWKQIRSLKLREAVLFLNLLGFEKNAEGQWSVPTGVKNMEHETFPSLSKLGEALIRVPDLEDRTNGEKTHRRSARPDPILNDKQMMALRLRIAEGLEDEKTSSSVIRSRKTSQKAASAQKPASTAHQSTPATKPTNEDDASEFGEMSLTDSCSEEKVEKAQFGVCCHEDAWTYLQDLGCKYNGSTYRLPKDGEKCQTQNELVQYILNNSVSVLDWDCCTLTREELEALEFYLRCFTAKMNSDSPTKDAMKLVEEGNVLTYLRKIGVTPLDHSTYKIGGRCDKYTAADLANEIRCAPDLCALASADGTPSRRHKPLSELEILAVRLWSISFEVPLKNFPDPATFQEQQKQRKLKSPIAEVVTKPVSKVMDLEEIPIESLHSSEGTAQHPNASDEFFTPASKASESSSCQKTSSRPSTQGPIFEETKESEEDNQNVEMDGEAIGEKESLKERVEEIEGDAVNNEENEPVSLGLDKATSAAESPAAQSKVSSFRDETQGYLEEERELDKGFSDEKESPIEHLDNYMALDSNLLDAPTPGDSLFRARNKYEPLTQEDQEYDEASDAGEDLLTQQEDENVNAKRVRDPLDFLGCESLARLRNSGKKKPKATYGSQKNSRASQQLNSSEDNIFAARNSGRSLDFDEEASY